MTQKNTELKITIGLLSAVLLATIIYTVDLYQDNKETTQALMYEKALVVKDLDYLKSEYDELIQGNANANKALVLARDNIAKYIDSVQLMKADIATLSRYRQQFRLLRFERVALLKRIDSLKESNDLLTMQRDSTFMELERQSMFNDSLIMQNTQLANALDQGAFLTISEFSVNAVREKGNGKFTATKKSKIANRIKVCFTIADNAMAAPGDKVFFIEVFDPRGNVMGNRLSESNNEEGTSLTYTRTASFYYENTALDICEYINKPILGFQSGGYTVNIYDERLKLLRTSRFNLE